MYRIIVQFNHLIIALLITCFSGQIVFSQTYSSRNNYTGDWEQSYSWNPVWNVPQTSFLGGIISINGYITVNGSLSFSGPSSKLIIYDTLVIKGNLTLGDNNDLTINDNGILIIRGSLSLGNQTIITANGYLIITSDIIKNSSIIQGSVTSNDDPVKIFVEGTIPAELTGNNALYSAIDCINPVTIRYPTSNCSYGNMTDLLNDPVYSFFQTTCLAPQPGISLTGETSFCDGGSVTLTSTPGSSYLWSTGATTANINVTTSGIYSVKVTNAAGCLSAPSAEVTVTVNPLPVTPTITADRSTTFCDGGDVTLISSPAASYLWSNGGTGSNIIVNKSGSYTVQVTDNNGCTSAVSVPVVVTVYETPASAITAQGPTTFCAGGDVTLTAGSGSSYLWSNGATTESIILSSAGLYSVKITDANGCLSAASPAIAVNVNAPPVVDAGINATIPYGTSTTLNATVTGIAPFAFSWSPSMKLINALIEDPITANLTSTTAFTLTTTSQSTSCSASDEVTITISGGPLNSNPSANPSTICSGTAVQLHSLAGGGSGSYSYTWTSSPAGFFSSATNPVVNPSVTTTYNCAVSDGFNTVNSQVMVTVNPLPPTPTITADGPISFCTGGSVNLATDSEAGYLWSNDADVRTIDVKTGGTFTVQTINSYGCYSQPSLPLVVTVNPLPLRPTITASGPTTFCSGGSVDLTSGSGTTYLWSNAAITPVINVTSGGNYSVQVTNEYGCQSISSVAEIITLNPLPQAPVITADGPTTFCEGDVLTLTSSSAASYIWSDGLITPDIRVSASGIYSVRVKNANGCQSQESVPVSVVVNSLPAIPIITVSGPLTFCSGGSVTLTSSSAAGYLWSNGSTSQGIDVKTSDQYSVQAINTYGCQSASSAPAEVIVNKSPVAIPGPDQELKFTFETQMNAELSGSETGEWSLVSGSAHIIDINSPTTRITGLDIGENRFRWKVHNSNCETAAEVIITVYDEFVPSVITPNGDGKNDFFKISKYTGKVQLIIINRWGNEEYSNSAYLNDWDGRNNKGIELPADTYFYILKFDNGKVLKGSVLVKR